LSKGLSNRPHILAIEDEIAIARLLPRMLGTLGYEATVVGSAQEVRELLDASYGMAASAIKGGSALGTAAGVQGLLAMAAGTEPKGPQYAAVFLDNDCPYARGGSEVQDCGYGLALFIQETYIGLPVGLTSGRDNPQGNTTVPFLQKPYKRGDLESFLAKLVSDRHE
ncbi:hypothetical protein COV94_06770, partial [Candidatus Woesearchaeota archaeon CG11_big_fil_rev_8_21_14_0_20_57_5]